MARDWLGKTLPLRSTQGMLPRDGRLDLLVSALSTVAALGCATSRSGNATGTPVSSTALDYYPLFPGWGWAYEIEREGTSVLALYSVADKGADFAIVQHGEERIEYALLPDGIARREGRIPGDYLLKTPVRDGNAWPVANGTATVVQTGKSVTLPSVTLRDCAVVEEVRSDPGRVTRTTYCRGAGPVDIEMRVFSPGKQIYEVFAHARIMSVSPPEDAVPSK